MESIANLEDITKEKIQIAERIDFKSVPDSIVKTDEYGFLLDENNSNESNNSDKKSNKNEKEEDKKKNKNKNNKKNNKIYFKTKLPSPLRPRKNLLNNQFKSLNKNKNKSLFKDFKTLHNLKYFPKKNISDLSKK